MSASPYWVWFDWGYDVLLPDLPGHGDSPYPWTTLGAREGRVVAAVAAAGDWPQPLILHGRSMGAVAVIGALSDSPPGTAGEATVGEGIEVAGVVLEAPYASLYDTVCRRFQLMELPCVPAAALMLGWGGVLTGTNPFALNPVEQVAAIAPPVLVLGGGADRRVPPEVLETLVARIGVGRADGHPLAAQLHLFPGVGHRSLRQASPSEFKRLLGGFLFDRE